MKELYKCACGDPHWVVTQTGFTKGNVRCKKCDTRIVFELITIEYTA